MILNPKTVDPRNENSSAVFQIETANGSRHFLIRWYNGCKGSTDPLFSPVKSCNDLLSLRSDCYVLGARG